MARPGSNSPRTDKRPRHVVDTYYDMASDDPGLLQVWAYSDRMSYHAGETLALHVNTTGAHYDIEIGRDGLEQERYERFAKLRVSQGRAVPGIYPPNEDAKAEYAEWLEAGEPNG